MFELATQASFKFSVKEMVIKRKEKVKPGCLSFGYFSFGNAKKSNTQKPPHFSPQIINRPLNIHFGKSFFTRKKSLKVQLKLKEIFKFHPVNIAFLLFYKLYL
ncbi:hypothetical protein CFY87_08850 [Actinobacillus seminis]|uniref:Uncharacterized protein n=1 Tax=Actinobacillus seminis TaxID=722 RepID=A0ABX4FMX4_9PAST|nr:hypothetical protein CFY87_08850 [Actinobacillus seminis]